MRYLGYEIKLDGGRYKAYSPSGEYIGSASDAPDVRKWIREHRAAAKRVADVRSER